MPRRHRMRYRSFGAGIPTLDEIAEATAADTADTLRQIANREGAYYGLGADISAPPYTPRVTVPRRPSPLSPVAPCPLCDNAALVPIARVGETVLYRVQCPACKRTGCYDVVRLWLFFDGQIWERRFFEIDGQRWERRQ